MPNLFRALAGAALTLLAVASWAQTVHPTVPDGELASILRALDKRHFDAFNNCDLETLAALYAANVEFYHDLNGRILNRDQFLAAVKKNICGKVQRRLEESSLEAYPLAKVGALQMGRHCFIPVGGTQCVQSGRFMILWKYDGVNWQASKVFSYDHQNAK
jgi:hypothetical protein